MLRERTSSGAGGEPWSQHKLAAQRLPARHCLGVHAETFTERGEGAVWDLLKLLQNLLGTGQEIFGLGHPVTYPVQGWVCLCPPCAGEALWLSLGVCQQAGRAQG